MRKSILALWLALSLAGCANLLLEEGQPDPAREVGVRAAERWGLLIKGDLAGAYEYLSPGAREVMSLDVYRKKTRPGSWKKAEVEMVSCEQDRCNVTMVIEYSYREMKSIETRLNEVWLQEGGKWWYVPRK